MRYSSESGAACGEKLIGRMNYKKLTEQKYRRERSRAKCLCRISLLTNQFKSNLMKTPIFPIDFEPSPAQKLCGIAILIESIFLFFFDFRLCREPFPKLS